MDGDLSITINSDENIDKGTCVVTANFTDDEDIDSIPQQVECNTIILDKSELYVSSTLASTPTKIDFPESVFP